MQRASVVCLCLCLVSCVGDSNGERGVDDTGSSLPHQDMPADQEMDAMDAGADMTPTVLRDMREESGEEMGSEDMDLGMRPQDMMADLSEEEEDTSFLSGRVKLPGVLTVEPLRRGVVPEGMVGVAVGVGHGRIVTLCNQGRVIASDQVYAPGADDHDPYSAKGLTFGNGIFLHSTGHGAPGFLLRSVDAINWEQLPGERFHYADGSTGDLPGGTATVYFADDRFVLSLGRRRLTSTDGLDWFEEGETLERNYFHFRTNHYSREVGAHFQAGTNSSKDVNWLIRSDDQGTSYRQIEGVTCDAPDTFGHGALLSTDRLGGDPCISLDGGETWGTFSTNTEESQSSYMAVDDGFVAFKGYRRTFYHSTDLVDWTEHTISALRYGTSARSPEGYYMMTSRQNEEFYRSDDGVNWDVVESASQDVPAIKQWTFGYVPPFGECLAN